MKGFYLTLLAGGLLAVPGTIQQCGSTDYDADNDGYDSVASGGDDCDDNNASVNPAASEVCDDIDNNCDGLVDVDAVDASTYYTDADGDGYGTGEGMMSCTEVGGSAAMGGDCDDTNASVHPGAEEVVVDGADSNCNGHQDYTSTVAGTGVSGFSGDGGQATAALLYNPFSAVVDTEGNLYIADTGNHRIRKVDARGVITTIAGTGVAGYGGDNGPATSAQLNYPRGLVLDSVGNLYIADSSNQRVRMIDLASANPRIYTVVGTGSGGYNGDGQSAATATLAFPYGLAVDSADNLYIADSNNHRIRVVMDGMISTVAGNGTAGSAGDGSASTAANLNFPRAVSLNSMGDLFIADTSNYRVRKVAASTGVISTYAGTGLDGYSGDNVQATSTKLNDLYGLAVDSFDDVYIADTDNQRIRKVESTSGVISTVVGTGTSGYSGDGVEQGSTAAKVNIPYTVTATPDGDLLFADTRNHVVRKVQW